MAYIKSLGVIILMIHLTQAQQVDQKEVLEGNQGEQYTSIDNDNLYAEPRLLKQGQYLYPVIFEPIKNIRLSISSYSGHNVCGFRTLFRVLRKLRKIPE